VEQLSNGVQEISITMTTQLPAQPTGLLSAIAGIKLGWDSIAVGLIDVSVGLGWLIKETSLVSLDLLPVPSSMFLIILPPGPLGSSNFILVFCSFIS
jgi:hypothetical protein